MKIAIHHRTGSFSERWISYCQENNIPYKIVNCYKNDIINQVRDCDALMWHHHHAHFKDAIVAKRILLSLTKMGIHVFPDLNTNWHFDDKVAQKYLLEAVSAPVIPSYVFYDRNEALTWAYDTSYPKVFKLKGGAGASNVRLVKTRNAAIKLINRAFGRGFSQFNRLGYLKDSWSKAVKGKSTYYEILKGFVWFLFSTKYAKLSGRERGYIYFQEYIANNSFDIRVIVVGEKAFAIKRLVRENDFRASGSGIVIYDKNEINTDCLRIAFETNKKICMQSVAYDFIFDVLGRPLIVELSYGFSVNAYDNCPGYWDSELNWHERSFNPQEWMVENLIKSINKHESYCNLP